MKSFFKKSAISLLVLGMAGASHAAMQNNSAMWAPHMTGWFIGVEGLDLRPMNGDLDYVTSFPSSIGGSFYTSAISTDYQWSWRLFGGVKFTDNDDITVSWTRMRADDKDSIFIPNDNGAAPRFLSSNSWDTVSGKVDFDLDDVYAVWGHTINFNNPWSVRFAGGLDWVKLNSDMTVDALIFNSSTGVNSFTAHNHLTGFGPRVEFDMTYHLPYNFALFANTNAALFVSDRKISGEPFIFNTEQELFNVGFSTRHVVVPKFGMRLGGSYAYMFGQSGGEGASVSALTIDLGWQVESYIHAIERLDSSGVSNFGDQGLFIGVKYSAGWL